MAIAGKSTGVAELLNALDQINNVLEPIAGLALAFGLKYPELRDSQALPRAFVMAAKRALASENGRASMSRIAMRAGVDRKVPAQFILPGQRKAPPPRHINRVLDTWRQRGGGPIPLRGFNDSFQGLCVEAGEPKYLLVLDELIAAGCVEHQADLVSLISPVLVSNEISDNMLAVVAMALGELARAMEHNINPAPGEPHIKYIQRIFWSDQIPQDQSESVLAELREILSDAHRRCIQVVEAAEVHDDATPTCRVSVGVYTNSAIED